MEEEAASKSLANSKYNSTLFDSETFLNHNNINHLKTSIANSDYFAFDTEFGLLCKTRGITNVDDYYKLNRENFLRAALFQIGLTCFKFNNNSKLLEFNSFSIYVIPKSYENGDTFILVNPSNLKFLCEHKFDFSLAFGKAIEYQRPVDENKLELENGSKESKESIITLKELFELIFEAKKPWIVHDGIQDLLYLFNNFIDVLSETFDDFKKDLLKKVPIIYDTKFLFKNLAPIESQPEKISLGTLYEHFQAKESKIVSNIEYLSTSGENNKSTEGSRAHDAAYDSFMTAFVFLGIQSEFNISDDLQNKLYCRLPNIQFIDLK